MADCAKWLEGKFKHKRIVTPYYNTTLVLFYVTLSTYVNVLWMGGFVSRAEARFTFDYLDEKWDKEKKIRDYWKSCFVCR